MTDVTTAKSNDRNEIVAGVTNVLPNLDIIEANFILLANAINSIQPGTVDLGTLTLNSTPWVGLLGAVPADPTVQTVMNVLDTKNQAQDYNVIKTNFDGAFAGFTGNSVQELFDYCDGNLQPLITEQPNIQNLAFTFPLVQPNGWNIFDDLADAARTFNADVTRPTDFTRIELRANGTEIATFTNLTASSRNVQIVPAQSADWATAVAAGGTDGSGRTIVNMVLEGFLPSPAANIVSNTVQILIGAPAQTETIYHGLSTNSNGVTVPTFELTQAMALGNPATITVTENPITLNTSPAYWHVLIPADFDTVAFTQITGGLGNISANNYFPNFDTPPTRTINGEVYNVYTSSALVPEFTGQFRIVMQDTT